MLSRGFRAAAARAAAGAGAVAFATSVTSLEAEVPPWSAIASYPANHPIEDRSKAFSMGDSVQVASVFDGHGGWQCSEFAMNNIEPAVQAERANASGDPVKDPKELARLLSRVYGRLDRDFAAAVRPAFRLGFEKVGRTGSCALTCAVTETHLVVANAGDCRAVLGTSEDDNAASSARSAAFDLSRDHNAKLPAEKERLAREHPGEADIVLCKSPTACYVKGHLQPTRALGDLYLKLPEFNGVKGDRSRGRFIKPPYSPPYVLNEPELHVRPRMPGDRFVVLASDGLWDAMSSAEAVAFVDRALSGDGGGAVPRGDVARALVQDALRREAAASQIPLSRLLNEPAGRARRNLHDDVTVVIVYLDGRGGSSSASSGDGAWGWLSSLFGAAPKAE